MAKVHPALSMWAEWAVNGEVFNPTPKLHYGGDRAKVDFVQATYNHVERFWPTLGFDAREVVKHVVGYGFEPHTYRWKAPFEHRGIQVMERKWFAFAAYADDGICGAVYHETLSRFAEWIEKHPAPSRKAFECFVGDHHIPKDDDAEWDKWNRRRQRLLREDRKKKCKP